MDRVSKNIVINEDLVFEKKSGNRSSFKLPEISGELPAKNFLPENYLRDEIEDFPQLNEVEIARHFSRLSNYNYHLDLGLYPLGSCTMKYNPKLNERIASMREFTEIHPFTPYEHAQGILKILKDLEDLLLEITGMDGITLQPTAGAHGELTGMLLIRALLEYRGNPRKVVLIPDSAHGTNPASATLCGYKAITIKSDEKGCIDLDDFKEKLTEDVACLMLTNPNTLGIFEENILEISKLLHENGSLLYMDGANFNAFMGKARPGDMGVDVMHLNVHKTFSTPHGGGGPGAGPVAVKKELIPFLPLPRIEERDGKYHLNFNGEKSIGKVATFYGNVNVLIKTLAYILKLGSDGIREVSEMAVLNANYIRTKLKEILHLEYDTPTLHEVVFDDKFQEEYGISTMDMAKRLLDKGFHPPTVYFPLIVHGALMIEPTETESKEELDEFIKAFKEIVKEARENPEKLHSAPENLRRKRFDEVLAARKPVLKWKKSDEGDK